MELLSTLLEVRASIKKLEDYESEIVQTIIEKTKHTESGQRTYEFEGRKVVIKTGNNITLDKSKLNAAYDAYIKKWGEAFPINRSYAYTPRTKDLDAALTDGSPDLRKALAEIVTSKPSKPTVKVEG